jgi:nitrate reductase NapE component
MVLEVAAIVALVFTAISLYSKWRERRPNLRVSPNIEVRPLPITSDGQGGFADKNTVALCIYLSNPSEKPVHVSSVYLKPRKAKMIQLDQFHALAQGLFPPFTIEPLRGYTFVVWGEKLAKLLGENGLDGNLQAEVVVQDEVNKQYKSKPLRFAVHQLRDQEFVQEESGG